MFWPLLVPTEYCSKFVRIDLTIYDAYSSENSYYWNPIFHTMMEFNLENWFYQIHRYEYHISKCLKMNFDGKFVELKISIDWKFMSGKNELYAGSLAALQCIDSCTNRILHDFSLHRKLVHLSPHSNEFQIYGLQQNQHFHAVCLLPIFFVCLNKTFIRIRKLNMAHKNNMR